MIEFIEAQTAFFYDYVLSMLCDVKVRKSTATTKSLHMYVAKLKAMFSE